MHSTEFKRIHPTKPKTKKQPHFEAVFLALSSRTKRLALIAMMGVVVNFTAITLSFQQRQVPHVLLRLWRDQGFNRTVHRQCIGFFIASWEVLQRRQNVHFITAESLL